jgi:hypothetical protein
MNKEWATILSGQPRADMESAKNDYNEFISDLGEIPDNFCHIMTSSELLSTWGNGGWNGNQTKVRSIQDVKDIWSPLSYKTDIFENLHFNNDYIGLAGGLSMTYGIKKTFEIMEEYEKINNLNYKYVIKYRYDLNLFTSKDFFKRKQSNKNLNENIPLFGKLIEPNRYQPCDFWGSDCLPDLNLISEIDNKIDWEWIKTQIDDKNTIVLTPGWNWSKYACCDLFLIGSKEVMKKYSLYHDEYEDLKKKYDMNEIVLRTYLEKLNNIRIINYYFGDIGIYR